MPALMPTRNGSVVYFEQQLRVDRALEHVAAVRAEHPEIHPTLFHVVLWAMARTFERHPRINRYVAGGRLYQRDDITIVFTVKSELSDSGTLLEVKHRFDPSRSFPDLVADLQAEIGASRGGQEGLADKELGWFLHLPPALRRGLVRLAGAANAVDLLPRAFIDGDPFFGSAFVTNLGSVGLDSAYHHLYEYGTIPVFGALGRVHETVAVVDGVPAVVRTASMKFTYDERVEDGLYAATSLADFQHLVEHPEDG